MFCKKCLQGYHIGDCITDANANTESGLCQYSVDPEVSFQCAAIDFHSMLIHYANILYNSQRVAEARWDEASRVTIKVISKPCPKCRTPTERSGGCMHMVCTRSGCSFEWCWVCQTEWTRDCMGAHWFG